MNHKNKSSVVNIKQVLVTGATAGIGLATAELFIDSGASVIVTGRRKDRLEVLQKKFKDKIKVACFDIQKESQVEKFVKEFKADLKKMHVLVNNAGLAKGTEKFQDANIADWEAMIQTNVMGLLYMTRKILPFFIAKNEGHIVNIGSVAGRWSYPGGAVYCASKFAVRALTEGMRFDLMSTPIRVTNIEPGMVETEFSEVRYNDQAKAQTVYKDMKPLTAEDIAETILWTVQRPKHVNVQELVIFPTQQAGVGPSYVHRNK